MACEQRLRRSKGASPAFIHGTDKNSGKCVPKDNVYAESFSIMKKESEEYAKRLAEAKVLEEELDLARKLHAIIKFPTEASKLPLDYAILLLDSVGKFCWAKGIDPKISLSDAGLTDNSFCQNESVYLHELVYSARTALLRGTVPVGR